MNTPSKQRSGTSKLLGPDDAAWVEIGVGQANLKRYDDAVASFETALKENPDSIDAMVELASIVHLTDRGAAPVLERFAATDVAGSVDGLRGSANCGMPRITKCWVSWSLNSVVWNRTMRWRSTGARKCLWLRIA